MPEGVFWIEGSTIAVIFGLGIYCLVTERHLFKLLIGLNILSKAATMCVAVGGSSTGNVGEGQSLMIALMMVEVVVTAVALSIMVNIYRHRGSLDVKDLMRVPR